MITYSDHNNKVQFNDVDSLYLAQYFMFTNWDTARVEQQLTSSETEHQPIILIQITIENNVIELAYNLANNTFLINENYYYADILTLLMMHRIFLPESLLGQMGELTFNATLEIGNELSHEKLYEQEKLQIENRVTLEWFDYVKENFEGNKLFSFINNPSDTIEELTFYEEPQIVLAQNLYFIDDNYSTKDGVKVGMHKTEVQQLLGKPNSLNNTRWGYLTGDYTRFNLLFEDDKVKYIYLLAPH